MQNKVTWVVIQLTFLLFSTICRGRYRNPARPKPSFDKVLYHENSIPVIYIHN